MPLTKPIPRVVSDCSRSALEWDRFLDLLAGYAKEFGSFSGPGTHDVFTLAIVIVSCIMITQPLGSIAHFSHRPHWERRLAKSPSGRQPAVRRWFHFGGVKISI